MTAMLRWHGGKIREKSSSLWLLEWPEECTHSKFTRTDSSGRKPKTLEWLNELISGSSSAWQPLELTCHTIGKDTSSTKTFKAAVSLCVLILKLQLVCFFFFSPQNQGFFHYNSLLSFFCSTFLIIAWSTNFVHNHEHIVVAILCSAVYLVQSMQLAHVHMARKSNHFKHLFILTQLDTYCY